MGYIVVKDSAHKYPRLVQVSKGGYSREEAISRYKETKKADVVIKSSKPKPKTKKILYVDDPVRQETRPATPYEQEYYEKTGELPESSTLKEEYIKESAKVEKPQVEEGVSRRPPMYIYDEKEQVTRPATFFEESYYSETGNIPVARTPYEQHYLDVAPEVEKTQTKQGVIYTIRERPRHIEDVAKRIDIDKEFLEFETARQKYRQGEIDEYEYAKEIQDIETKLNIKREALKSKINTFLIDNSLINWVAEKTDSQVIDAFNNEYKKFLKGFGKTGSGMFYSYYTSEIAFEKGLLGGKNLIKSFLPSQEDWTDYTDIRQEIVGAVPKAGKGVWEEIRPDKPENWVNLILLGTNIYLLGSAKQQQLTLQKSQSFETTPPISKYRASGGFESEGGIKGNFHVVSTKTKSSSLVISNKGMRIMVIEKLESGGYRTTFGLGHKGEIITVNTVTDPKGNVLFQDVSKIYDMLPDYSGSGANLPVLASSSQTTNLPLIPYKQQIDPNTVVAGFESGSFFRSSLNQMTDTGILTTSVKGGFIQKSEVEVFVSNYLQNVKVVNPITNKVLQEYTRIINPKINFKPAFGGSGNPQATFQIGNINTYRILSKEGIGIIGYEKLPDKFVIPSRSYYAFSIEKTEFTPFKTRFTASLKGMGKKGGVTTIQTPGKLDIPQPNVDIPVPIGAGSEIYAEMYRATNWLESLPSVRVPQPTTSPGFLPLYGLNVNPNISLDKHSRVNVNGNTNFRVSSGLKIQPKRVVGTFTTTFTDQAQRINQGIRRGTGSRTKPGMKSGEKTSVGQVQKQIQKATTSGAGQPQPPQTLNIFSPRDIKTPKKPKPFKFGFDLGDYRSKSRRKPWRPSLKMPRQYTPTLTAIMFNIKEKKKKKRPKSFLGLELRPIPKGWKIWKM